MAEHTKGEFTLAGNSIDVIADGWTVASFWGANGQNECDANRRLFVAAPALLAACEALPLDCFTSDSPDAADFVDNAESFMEAMRLARAAIAKARS